MKFNILHPNFSNPRKCRLDAQIWKMDGFGFNPYMGKYAKTSRLEFFFTSIDFLHPPGNDHLSPTVWHSWRWWFSFSPSWDILVSRRVPFNSGQFSHPVSSRHMGVSKNRGIPKMDGLKWKTLLKWMIWGYHYFRKHPYLFKVKENMKSCLASDRIHPDPTSPERAWDMGLAGHKTMALHGCQWLRIKRSKSAHLKKRNKCSKLGEYHQSCTKLQCFCWFL